MCKQAIGFVVFLGLCFGVWWVYDNYFPHASGVVGVELAAAYEGPVVPGALASKDNRFYIVTEVRLANVPAAVSEAQQAFALQGSSELVILNSKLPREQYSEFNINPRLRIMGVRIK